MIKKTQDLSELYHCFFDLLFLITNKNISDLKLYFEIFFILKVIAVFFEMQIIIEMTYDNEKKKSGLFFNM